MLFVVEILFITQAIEQARIGGEDKTRKGM
jgi:hypothetical protein